jgi:hypothetical protein
VTIRTLSHDELVDRACDVVIDRTVAIQVIPLGFCLDAGRRDEARFRVYRSRVLDRNEA